MENIFKNIKRVFCLFIVFGQLALLAGCLSNYNPQEEQPQNNVWSYTSFSYFDTVSYIYSYKGDEQTEFKENCNLVSKLLGEYHQLFDIYYEYSDLVNLCTINKNAGKEAMVVDQKLIDFLLYAKEIYTITKGETNVMLGPVLRLWHDARVTASDDPSMAYIPEMEKLEEALKYCSMDYLEIDDEKNTVRLSNEKARIDVGALGKGYATEKAALLLESLDCTSYVLNIGGNIRIIGTKPDGTGWNTGIKNPLGTTPYSLYLNISNTSCVTSGDYERYFIYEGQKYHHVIDKDTLMPSTYFSSVTILTKNSGLADALSTALFTMPYEEGRAIIDSLEDTEAIWIDKEGNIVYTDGVKPIDL